MLRPEYAGQPAAEARFRREATTAARLRHPNIVFIRDVGEAEGTVFVAMDLLPLSLARRLEVFPRLAEPEVVRFALEVAAALSIAHADGVVHRDIKPDNVMLGGNGEAIVADFGLAGAFTKDTGKSELDAEDHPGKVMGTPHYFSPEQAQGLDLDGRSDLYSLGVMCYRAATGTLPFEGEDWYSVARGHVEDPPVPPRMLVPELTEGFEAIILRLLAKKPEQRFASATQLADALLTLPTAPASHSLGLTPSSASVTQVAFPYLYATVGKRSRKRTAFFALLGVIATTVAAYVAFPSVMGNSRAFFTGAEELPPTTQVKLDSTPIPRTDSAKAPAPAPLPAALETKPTVKPAATVRPPAPPRSAYVTLPASESTFVIVNDTIKKFGTWAGSLPTNVKHHFSIVSTDNTVRGCKSAKVDTSLTFTKASETVNFDIGPCSVLLLSIRFAPTASYELASKTPGSLPKTGPLLVDVAQPIQLRNGKYVLTVKSEKCSNYTDTLVVIGRDTLTGSDTVKKTVPLNCPSGQKLR